MKIGIVGLGDIAQKAYLPLITQLEDVEPYFCTRSEDTLKSLGKKYRVENLYSSLDELLKEDLDAVFVHAATKAHYFIVKRLLQEKIATFVDKPMTYHLEKTEELIKLAKKENTILMTGFNRRYVPTYSSLLEIKEPKLIIMQKNRTYNPAKVREFILDDFIHVIDTLIYHLGSTNLPELDISKKMEANQLIQIMITLKNEENSAVGIMNRDNAITEETLEVIGFKAKKKIKNITQIIDYSQGGEKISQSDGWNKMGYNRGFTQMIAEFLKRVKAAKNNESELNLDLLTHRLAEKIVRSF